MSKLDALIWKWGQGCCDAHIDASGEIVIDEWKHATIPEPNETEIAQAITEYETFLQGEETKYIEYLSKINDLYYDQIDSYISAISNLADAKAFLKKLSKATLALVKVLKSKKLLED